MVDLRSSRGLGAAGLLGATLALAACGASIPEIPGGAPDDPLEAQIARLVGQGFTVVSDQRGSGGATALQFRGNPAAVLTCDAAGGRSAATDQTGSAPSADGRYVVSQTGTVSAYVLVLPTAGLRGIYINDLSRTVTTSDGSVVARQVETIEFPPGGSGQFRNGVTCQPKS